MTDKADERQPILNRCDWVDLSKPDYVAYHDHEWGVPVHDDRTLFEFLVLESAQAGLSWYTILKKREGYRLAFADYDPETVATFSEVEVEQLMLNPEIVRNRKKILATINNAQRFLTTQAEFGSFDQYIWRFVDYQPLMNEWRDHASCPAKTVESEAMALDLKKRGFQFLGATTCYAFMQAVGMVNDHLTHCFRYSQLQYLK